MNMKRPLVFYYLFEIVKKKKKEKSKIGKLED